MTLLGKAPIVFAAMLALGTGPLACAPAGQCETTNDCGLDEICGADKTCAPLPAESRGEENGGGGGGSTTGGSNATSGNSTGGNGGSNSGTNENPCPESGIQNLYSTTIYVAANRTDTNEAVFFEPLSPYTHGFGALGLYHLRWAVITPGSTDLVMPGGATELIKWVPDQEDHNESTGACSYPNNPLGNDDLITLGACSTSSPVQDWVVAADGRILYRCDEDTHKYYQQGGGLLVDLGQRRIFSAAGGAVYWTQSSFYASVTDAVIHNAGTDHALQLPELWVWTVRSKISGFQVVLQNFTDVFSLWDVTPTGEGTLVANYPLLPVHLQPLYVQPALADNGDLYLFAEDTSVADPVVVLLKISTGDSITEIYRNGPGQPVALDSSSAFITAP
jgi:hypothetical protein